MKSYIILIPVILLVIVLSIMSGGVTPGVRPAAISGGILIFIISLLLVAFSSPSSLSSSNPLLLPAVLISAGIVVQATAPVSIPGRIPLLEIVSYSLLASALIISNPSPRAVVFFIMTLAVWGIIMVGYGLVRRLLIAGVPGNIAATFVNRNHFCAFIGMIAPLCLSLALWAPEQSIRRLSGYFFLVIGSGVVLTGSRGGLAAFAVSTVAVLLFHLFRQDKKKTRWGYPLLYACGGLLIISILIFLIRETLYPNAGASLNQLSIRTRFSIWQSTFRIFFEHPWTGWGWGSFRYIYPLFKAPGVWYKVPHAHNELVELLAEGGVIGFSALAFCYIYSFLLLIRLFQNRNNGIFKALTSGTIGVLIYALIHSCFDFIFRLPANAFLLAGITGLGLSISLSRRRPVIGWDRRIGWPVCLVVIIFLAGSVFLPMIKYYRSYILYQRGLKRLLSSQPVLAQADLSAAIDLYPGESMYYLRRALSRALLFERSGDKIRRFKEIMSDFKVAAELNPWDSAIPRYQARLYRRLRAYPQAEDKLHLALRIDPTNPFIMMNLARLDIDRGRLNSAAQRLRRAAINYPPVGPVCIDMILSETDDYRILKTIPPPVAWLHRQLGNKLKEKGMWDKAGKEYLKALYLDPGDPANWLARGEADLLLGRYDDAIAAFEKASSIKPSDGYAWSRLGEVYLRMDEKKKALTYYRKAWSYEPGGRDYAKRIYLIVKDVEGNEAARRFLDEVTVRSPDWGWPYSARAELSLKERDYTTALKEIKGALQRDPEHPYYRKLETRIER